MRAKLRAALLALKNQAARALLVRAVGALPEDRAARVLRGYVDPNGLDGPPRRTRTPRPAPLLERVTAFHARSLEGEYRDSFNVNSKNWMEKSEGTVDWIKDTNQHFARCAKAVRGRDQQDVRAAFDLLFDLLARIDDGEDFVFFADEQGSFQVGVEFDDVLPAYFTSLAAVAEADEYAARVHHLVEKFVSYRRRPLLAAARKVATDAQRRKMRGLASRHPTTRLR